MRDNSAHLDCTMSLTRRTTGRCATASRLGRNVSRLSDDALLRRLARLVARDRVTTAALLAHIAEVDARRLYAPAGYPSMHAYCVRELRLSEDAASRRIQAARAARRVPALFDALAEGRLHLTAVCLLAPHITGENAGELVDSATHRGKAEIEAMLVRRLLGRPEYAPAHVDAGGATACGGGAGETGEGPDGFEHAPNDNLPGDEHALAHVVSLPAEAVTPSWEIVSLHITVPRSTHEKLRYAQALLSHAVPSGDPAEVLDRALDALIEKVEKRRFGAGAGARRPRAANTGNTARPSPGSSGRDAEDAPQRIRARSRQNPRDRYIPAAIRRAVWERDGGRCTFEGTNGHRCEARHFLEFDHVEPVARGGLATVEGVRLRCRTHNQCEAERVFEAGFMENKRREARETRMLAKEQARALAREQARALAREQAQVLATDRARPVRDDEQIKDILACLRGLGCRATEARRAAERAASMRDATLEERLRAALQTLGRRAVSGSGMPPPTRLS